MDQPPARRTEAEDRSTRSVSDLVFQTLRARIVEGALAPGDNLPGERKLSVDLGVNRGAVREGLKRLEQAGLVAIQHGGPTRVLDFRRSPGLGLLAWAIELRDGNVDAKVARSYLELYRCISPHIARLAAERTGAKLAQALESQLRELRQAEEQKDEHSLTLGRAEFWCTLARGSENLAYVLAMSAMREATRVAAERIKEPVPKAPVAALAELAYPVVAGDGDAAEARAEAVTATIEGRLLRSLEGRLSVPGSTRFEECRIVEPLPLESRDSVSHRVFASLRERIVTEAIPPGASLPGERALATEFDVNRGAVREALKRLEQLRLVAIQHGGSTRVLDYRDSPSLELLAQSLYGAQERLRGAIAFGLVEMRTRVVPDLARLAAARGGARLRPHLEAALAALDTAEDVEAERGARARFWNVLAFGSDNLAYRFLLHVVHEAERCLRSEHRDQVAAAAISSRELAPLAEAVARGDAQAARRAALACARALEGRMRATLLALAEIGELD